MCEPTDKIPVPREGKSHHLLHHLNLRRSREEATGASGRKGTTRLRDHLWHTQRIPRYSTRLLVCSFRLYSSKVWDYGGIQRCERHTNGNIRSRASRNPCGAFRNHPSPRWHFSHQSL